MTTAVRWLELKVPPPLVALVAALGMWGVGELTPALEVPAAWRWTLAGCLAVAGTAVRLAAQWSFRRANTTVNPLQPGRASSVITSGLYGRSRNPMYLGRTLQLLAWAAWLASPAAGLGVPAYVAYVWRFQILPEERLLLERFGPPYADYLRRVPRWL